MTIDWTKPIELIDGTPLTLSETGFLNDGPNPDRDGDYWVEREDGYAVHLSPYNGFAKFCSRPDGVSGGVLLVRNRTEQPVGIDWTKPIETVPCRFNPEPVEVQVIHGPDEDVNTAKVHFPEGFKRCDDGRDGVGGYSWFYSAKGTIGNAFLPDLRNKVEVAEPEFDPAAWLEQGRRHADRLPEGVVLPEPQGFDYEPYRAALQEFYDVRELYMEVSIPFDTLDKRWVDALIAAYKLFPAPTSTDWIEWRGGSCPEHLREARIAIQWREADPDGSQSSEIRLGKAWDWSHTGSEGDIVRYRVVKP